MANIYAPWTDEQVKSLNHYQTCGHFHPYTCSGSGGKHQQDLIAKKYGWFCPQCDRIVQTDAMQESIDIAKSCGE
jgi:hypothetical protein